MDMDLYTGTPATAITAGHDEAADRRAANRAVAVSAVGLAATGGIELALALLTGSVALLGDAIHNLSDVSTSAVIYLGFWFSKRKPTETYPYGFERAEDLAGLGVALAIWLSAVFAGYQSYEKLIHHTGTSLLAAGMVAAVIGMAGNFLVSRYKRVVARRIHSATLEAEAQHSWLDVLSSVGAFIGLVGVALGARWADPIAGFAVTLFIVHVGYEVTHDILRHLMDGVEPEHIAAAQAALAGVPGITDAVIRGRWLGRTLAIEIEAGMAPSTTLAQAGAVSEQVSAAVRAADEAVRQVQFVPRRTVAADRAGT
jgi:cation diffusion facilitator family transporter